MSYIELRGEFSGSQVLEEQRIQTCDTGRYDPNHFSISQNLFFGYTFCVERRYFWHLPQPRLITINYEALSIIFGTGARICTAVVVARYNGR
jgi:hypothetical protein